MTRGIINYGNGTPQRKGIYIHNGKKTVIK